MTGPGTGLDRPAAQRPAGPGRVARPEGRPSLLQLAGYLAAAFAAFGLAWAVWHAAAAVWRLFTYCPVCP